MYILVTTFNAEDDNQSFYCLGPFSSQEMVNTRKSILASEKQRLGFSKIKVIKEGSIVNIFKKKIAKGWIYNTKESILMSTIQVIESYDVLKDTSKNWKKVLLELNSKLATQSNRFGKGS